MYILSPVRSLYQLAPSGDRPCEPLRGSRGQNMPKSDFSRKWDFSTKKWKISTFCGFFHSLWIFPRTRWEPPGNTPGQPQATHKPPWGASGGLGRSKWAKIGQNGIFPQKSGKSQLFVDFFHSLWNFAIIRWEPPGITPGQPQITHKPPWRASGGQNRPKSAKLGQTRPK